MNWIIEHWDALLAIGAMVLTTAAAIARLTPTKADDEFIGKLQKLFGSRKPPSDG